MSPKSFAVRIFFQDGTVGGVKIIAKSKWTGRGMVIPRTQLSSETHRKELDAPGVYLLLGSTLPGIRPKAAIGAAERVGLQLDQEDADKDFWTTAVAFTSKKDQLLPVHVQYIAARLVGLAQESDCSDFVHSVKTEAPILTATEQEDVEAFLEHLLCICKALGVTMFENHADRSN